jgi:molybdate transport system substrate-binding protein
MKKNNLLTILASLSFIFAFGGCSSTNLTSATTVPQTTTAETKAVTKADKPVELLVGAAASLKNAMTDIEKVYKTENANVTLTFTYGASGALQQQIEQGAPVDVFISAATKQMKALEDGGLILQGSKKEILENKVVLIVPKGNKLGITSFEQILKAKLIALGEPASVPVGQYSEEIFTYLKTLDQVKAKATYGKDVTEVLTWVSTGNVDAGVVYATDAASSDAVEVVASAPEGSCSKVIYPAAVVKASKEAAEAQKFVEFLTSDKAVKEFEKYGFSKN